jgi:hypothetical protein
MPMAGAIMAAITVAAITMAAITVMALACSTWTSRHRGFLRLGAD